MGSDSNHLCSLLICDPVRVIPESNNGLVGENRPFPHGSRDLVPQDRYAGVECVFRCFGLSIWRSGIEEGRRFDRW